MKVKKGFYIDIFSRVMRKLNSSNEKNFNFLKENVFFDKRRHYYSVKDVFGNKLEYNLRNNTISLQFKQYISKYGEKMDREIVYDVMGEDNYKKINLVVNGDYLDGIDKEKVLGD
ncbi:hypothetical protein [Helicobacter anseris]|nr:hypothetical protein [Helicobacter anseris]